MLGHPVACTCAFFALGLGLAADCAAQVQGADIDLAWVTERAKARAAKPFASPARGLPEVLREENLNYDRYRGIRFRREKALWREEGSRFWLELFHPGYIYHEPVGIHEFSANAAQRVRFVQEFFDYGSLHIKERIPVDTGYAGFRLLHPLNDPKSMDELAVFQGASYFRVLGRGQRYGQSARGLAIDAGGDGPEEFPIFTDFWLGKPAPDANTVSLFALLDSVSAAGAYEFTIVPGDTTRVDVRAVLFLRTRENGARDIATLGLAPLTSMFWFGENSERKPADYRQEVHDSDGLLIHTGAGEVIWRPLSSRPDRKRYSVFSAGHVRGFGLLQRDRAFDHYHDLFNPYHLTPSVFVQIEGDWGEGEVHLVELDTLDEYKDNVVAFWTPALKPAPMEPWSFAYQMLWTHERDVKLSENQVIATRVGTDIHNERIRQFAVDFSGPLLAALGAEQPPQATVSCSPNAHIAASSVHLLPEGTAWRVMIKVEPAPDNADPVNLRCTLSRDGRAVSETWDYLWTPVP